MTRGIANGTLFDGAFAGPVQARFVNIGAAAPGPSTLHPIDGRTVFPCGEAALRRIVLAR